jgi:hypothetical protein
MRQYLKVIEGIGHSVCRFLDEEFITKGGRKPLFIKRMIEDANEVLHGKHSFYDYPIEDEEKMIMYTNIDHTKWSAGMTINIFAYQMKALYNCNFISKKEFKWVLDGLYKLEHKKILVDTNLITSFSENAIIKELINLCDDKLSFICKGNWIQGKLNKCSSLLNCSKDIYSEYICRSKLNIPIFVKSACHSDDGATICVFDKNYSASYYGGERCAYKLWRIVQQFTGLCLNMQESRKKTSESQRVFEFISTFVNKSDIQTPIYKGTGNLTTKVPLDTYDKIQKSFLSIITDSFVKGASLLTMKTLQRLTRRCNAKLFSKTIETLPSDCNLPIELGGQYDGPILPIIMHGGEIASYFSDEDKVNRLIKMSIDNHSITSVYSPTCSIVPRSRKYEKALKKLSSIDSYSSYDDESTLFTYNYPEYTITQPKSKNELILYKIREFHKKNMRLAYMSFGHLTRIRLVKNIYFSQLNQFRIVMLVIKQALMTIQR